jgi:ribonuclease HI
MSLDPHALKIYIDGSAFHNPGGAGGVAAWIEFPIDWNMLDEQLFQEGFQETTNNRMELVACIRAFEYVRDQGRDVGVERVQIVTDSQYVRDGYYLVDRWRKNGWRNLDGRPVENRDLWKRLLTVRSKGAVKTELTWMLGKKSPILKAVDKSAKSAATQPWRVDRGFKPGRVAPSKTGTRSAASLFPAAGQEAIIRIYRHRIVGSDHKFYFDVFSQDSGGYIRKACAFTHAEIALDLHTHHVYRVLFNDNPKYPIIEKKVEELPLAWPKQTTA